MNPDRKVKNIIVKSAADVFTPLALVFGFVVIMHGQLSPGGGFQGGVIVAAAILLLFLGYGQANLASILKPDLLKKHESVAAILYVLLACLGLFAAVQFCSNILFNQGQIGDLFSSGTIMLMNYAVGYKVLTGVGCLLLILLALLATDNAEDNRKRGEEA